MKCLRLFMLSVGLVAIAGCAQLPVRHIPGFLITDNVDSLAVAPFRTPSHRARGVGYELADRLAAALAANGTYDRVYSRSDLDILANERQLRRAAGRRNQLAKALRHATDVSAILTGTIIEYRADSFREIRHEAVCRDASHGPSCDCNSSFTDGHRRRRAHAVHPSRRIVFIRNEAAMAVTATLLSAETGEILHATTVPIRSECVSEGSPPEWTIDECLDIAMSEIIGRLVGEFAVTTSTITIDPNKALIVTDGTVRKDKWQEQDEFDLRDREIVIVVDLPDAAHLNVFDLVIRRKDSRSVLVEETIVWDAGLAGSGLTLAFDLTHIAAIGGGPGKYEVVFYASGEEVMKQGFKIVESE